MPQYEAKYATARTPYDEATLISQWRELATQRTDAATRQRLLRLADQLEEIVSNRRMPFKLRSVKLQRMCDASAGDPKSRL